MSLFLNSHSLLGRRRQPSNTAMIQDRSQLYNLPLYSCSDFAVEVTSRVVGRERNQAGMTLIRDSPQLNKPLLYLGASLLEAIYEEENRDTKSTLVQNSTQPYSPQLNKSLLYLGANLMEAIYEEKRDPNKPLSGSISGSVEVARAMTDREDERSIAQDSGWPSLDGPVWHYLRDSHSKKVVPVVTESEAGRLLAARIPPELFENILFYVNVDRDSQRSFNNLERKSGTPGPNDTLTDLKQCSLVCCFWANRCREHIFQDKTLEINSFEDAEIFRRYVVGGCPRLTQVHQLVRNIQVNQNYPGTQADRHYKRQCSFLHLLYLPAIQGKFSRLFIEGPVPAGFNPAKLDTPHWGISPSLVVPSSFLRNNIQITYVHFPSFSHVIKYIRHFLCAAYIIFDTITWDAHRVPLILPHASSTIVCQRRPRALEIRAEGVCTDTVHLALTALMLNPNCPLHRVSEEECVWMIRFMTLLWGQEEVPNVWIGFNISEQATTMRMHPFHFVFEEVTAFTDRSASVLSVVGIHAYIHDFNLRAIPANLDALVNHARTHPIIRALALLFDSFDRLRESLEPFVEVLTLATETIELVLAYEKEEEECKAVGVDLDTLEANGRIWVDLPKTGLLEEYLKSSHILQTQLKKKIRGSVH